jgi:hypothetical protein
MLANELRMAMLTAVFAVVMVSSSLVFINQRSRQEATLLLRSLAISQARAGTRCRSLLHSGPTKTTQPHRPLTCRA